MGSPLSFIDPTGDVAIGFTGFLAGSDKPKDQGIEILQTELESRAPWVGPFKVFQHFEHQNARNFLQSELKRNCGQPIVIFGHSYGGAAAIQLARDYRPMADRSKKLRDKQIDIVAVIDGIFGKVLPWGHNVPVFPVQVEYGLDIYQRVDRVQRFRGNASRVESSAFTVNRNVNAPKDLGIKFGPSAHTEIDDNPIVRELVIQDIIAHTSWAR